MPKKSTALASPIKFEWGTFCKHVLTDQTTGELSLIGIIPGMSIVFQQQRDISATASKPNFVDLSLTPLSVFACFRRISSARTNLEVKVDFEVHLPGFESEQMKGQSGLMFAPQHEFGQLFVRINNPLVRICSKEGIYTELLKTSFSVNGERLGTVQLPIRFEVIAQ